ncbi:MAG: tripartite tricarboxylate transporter permease [Candidatus Accumulibacter sp.]|jgi:putative tricarboxylic transport membrane protein|nr:tripartite tricarboxylate transporter permease [Accumulibacter sp.]
MLEMLAQGFVDVFQPTTFALMVFGTFIGVIIGALPGMTGSMGIILLLPLSYHLPPHTALIMLSGVFCGSMVGGSVAAILLNTPGTPSAGATMLDGYPLCQRGQAGKAIGIATVASFAGGIVSTACLILIAPQLARVALQFQAADYFSLSIFGLAVIASASGKNILKGLISGWFGLLVSTVGIDVIVGSPRYTFGSYYMMGGLSLLPVLIGVFAMAQVFSEVGHPPHEADVVPQKITGMLPTWTEIKGIALATAVGAFLGVFIGIIPGAGGGIACFMAYNIMQKVSKQSEHYGTGVLEAIAAPEAANNGTTGGALIPMLTLGVPGDSITAVMLGAITLIGVRPGPLLFTETPHIVYAIFAGWILIQFVMLGMGFLSAKFAPYVLRVSPRVLLPLVGVFCIIGAYTLSNSLFDVLVTVVFGVIGFVMRKYGYPAAPLVLGVILGPMAESNLNRAMLNSNNDWTTLLHRPFSAAFLALSIVSVAVPLINAWRAKRKAEGR